MTKKRFRRGLAALGILAAFFLALMVMLFAPSLASAEKNSGPGHQLADESDANSSGSSGGASNPIYSEHSWQETEKVNWNAPPAGPCVEQSCAGETGDDTQYFADAPSGGSDHSSNGPNGNGGAGAQGGQGGQGNGSDAPHNGFAGGSGGGFPGGTFGDGNPQFVPNLTNDGDADKCDSDDSKSGKDDTDKTDKCESGDTDKDDTANSDNGDSDKGGGQDNSGSYGSSSEIFYNSNGPYELSPVDPQHFADTNPEIPPTDSTDDLPQQIPEPLTLSLFAVGLAGSVAMRRRTKVK